MKTRIDSVEDIIRSFSEQGYICSERIALAVYLAEIGRASCRERV